MSNLLRDDGQPNSINWREVYNENLPRIYNYLRFRIGDDFIAEDLTATTFEKAWRNRRSYKREISAFSTWLYAIASNLAIDYLRKKRNEVDISYLETEGSVPSAEEVLEQKDQFARLISLLEDLPARERELFAMKHGADFSNVQIAQLTDLTESNVGTILHRVAKQLRARWEVET